MPTQSYNAQTETTSVVSSVKNLAKNYGQGLLQTTAFMRQIYPQHRYNELNTIEQNFLAFQTISADEGAELKAVFSTYENNRYVLKGLQSKLLPLLEDATSLLEVLQEKIEYGYASVISAEDSEIDLPAGKLHPYEVIDDCELAQEKIGYLLDSLHVLSDKLNEHLTLQDSNMIENVRSFKRHEGMPTVKNLSEEVESVLTLVQKLGVYWAQRLPTSIHILKNMMGAKFFAGLDEFYQNVGSLQKLSFRALSVEQRGQEAEVKNLSEVFLELVKLKPAPLQKVGQ